MVNRSIALTQAWIQDFIIKESICPFASVPFRRDTISYTLGSQRSFPETIQEVFSICMQMRSDLSIDTAFYIIDDLDYRFEDLMELNLACTQLLREADLDSEFQLVSFHPRFQYEGIAIESPVHFTNRSPYPMLHLLRESDVTRAVDNYGDISSILDQNKATTQRLFGK